MHGHISKEIIIRDVTLLPIMLRHIYIYAPSAIACDQVNRECYMQVCGYRYRLITPTLVPFCVVGL